MLQLLSHVLICMGDGVIVSMLLLCGILLCNEDKQVFMFYFITQFLIVCYCIQV